MESILQNHPDPNLIYQQTLPTFRTALHVATLAGHVKIVEELVKLMTEESLGMQDCFGNTALFYAAIVGITKMAEIMINKNKRLITIANGEGYLPIVQACILNHKDMTHYLYRVILESKHDLASQEYSRHGSLLLQYSIESQMFESLPASDEIQSQNGQKNTMLQGTRFICS
ncbi:unnamed protein product [Dovyalis caffra]|uniref:Uncharacterized protein n=1 Tax=Dovyalis caffra TaxID=77055 RepID=A0AAV1QWT7_9ROSI|nr:unnamed protein product [Dovyalis caffra]